MGQAVIRILEGDCRETLKTLDSESVHTCVTSPPYWGLRDYGHAGQLGLETTPEEYVAKMVEVFREVKRVLRKDGTLWLNLGDNYATKPQGHADAPDPKNPVGRGRGGAVRPNRLPLVGLKHKDLVGIPWRVAFALQADGWYLRSDIIWAKPNPMPESCTDRPTKAHEYIFLLTKGPKYFYDHEAIKEPAVGTTPHDLTGQGWQAPGQAPQSGSRVKKAGPNAMRGQGSNRPEGGGRANRPGRDMSMVGQSRMATDGDTPDSTNATTGGSFVDGPMESRNKRTVWTVSTKPFAGAHFATFPPDLIEPCILAGTGEQGCCPKCGQSWVRQVKKDRRYDHTTTAAGKSKEGPYASQTGEGEGTHDIRHGVCSTTTTTTTTTGFSPGCTCDTGPAVPCTVLDPFGGAATTGLVSDRLGRNAVLCELNPQYVEMAKGRLQADSPLFAQVSE